MCNSKADSLPTSPATSKENTAEPEGDTAVPKKDTAGSQGDTTDGATSLQPSMGQNSCTTCILDCVFAK